MNRSLKVLPIIKKILHNHLKTIPKLKILHSHKNTVILLENTIPPPKNTNRSNKILPHHKKNDTQYLKYYVIIKRNSHT